MQNNLNSREATNVCISA